MSLSPHDTVAQARARRQTSSAQSSHVSRTPHPPSSPAGPSLRSTDSWIEISSKPSSSSLSSSADEVITHGLRVGHSEPQRHPRRSLPPRPLRLSLNNDRPASAAGSSQDEYTESESESDNVISSSNEALSSGPASEQHSDAPSDVSPGENDEDEDENATTLGTRNGQDTCFTPQPNAFSHPPASQMNRLHSNDSYFPHTRPSASRSGLRRLSFPAQRARQAQSPSNHMPLSNQPDHEAALRASLNTLLSCAAAARGLPKTQEAPEVPEAPEAETRKEANSTRPQPRPNSTRIEPSSLRIVAGSPRSRSKPVQHRRISSSPSRSATSSEKGKRKASRSSSKERRATKRLRCVGADEAISPTLLTWVVSAGVLVLVGALSFSAGVTVGKEAEKLQANGWSGLDTLSEGRRSRSGLGLRRRLFHGAVRAVAA